MRTIRLAALGLALVIIGGCQSANADAGQPTASDGSAFLNQLVAFARAGDFNGLCAVGDLNCGSELDIAGRDAVPVAAPRITESHYVAGSNSNGLQVVGGLVLSVCGVDGQQQPYRSQILVFRHGSSLAAINSVYWDNMTVADGGAPSTPPGPPPAQGPC